MTKRIDNIENSLDKLKSEINSLKESFGEILENFELDTKNIIQRISDIKKTNEKNFDELYMLSEKLLSKVKKIKGGIESLKNK